VSAFEAAKASGFATALDEMIRAAEKGRDSTIDLVAKIGRSSRLGERSRGVLDAGATSCCLILTSLGQSVLVRLS
jgi:dihydroxyacetone kinase